MKIGIYDPYLDDIGGGEKYMLTIAECLSDGNEIDIFWDEKKDFDLAKKRFGLKLNNTRVVNNIFKEPFFKKLLRTKNYDAIFVLSDGSIPLTLSRKLFLHIQRPISAAGNLKNKLKLKRAKKIFVNSRFTKDYIDAELGVESKVIYPPVNLKPKKIDKQNIILHVGRFRVTDKTVGGLSDYKKQNVMVEAFKKISKSLSSDWKFILAVSVKDEDMKSFSTMQNKTKGYPIEFVVNNTNDELWDLYSVAKIYWHASGFGEDLKKHPEYAEHFGISTVEAMGAGCVPVVINAGGQREIVEENISGLLWNGLDELEGKTLRVVNDSELFKNLSNGATKKAQEFTATKFCQEINKILKV